MAESDTQSAGFPLRVTFVMSSHPRYLPIIRATIAELAALAGGDEAECRAITLAVDEAIANIIRHAYHGRTDGSIELECDAGRDELRFRIRDTGDPPDPTLICSREIGCDQIGGLGTHIIRDVMDAVSYQSSPEGNRFTAAKRLRKST